MLTLGFGALALLHWRARETAAAARHSPLGARFTRIAANSNNNADNPNNDDRNLATVQRRATNEILLAVSASAL